MRKFVALTAITVLCFATLASAQAPERFFDLPKFTVSPIIDGDRSSVVNEWAGALEFDCSPTQILADGAEFGWRDIEQQSSEVSANQLSENGETEQAGEGRTDIDFASTIWQAWDDEALYYITEARDNIRDITDGGEAISWWERDSMSLYLDLNNEDHPGGDNTGEYVNLNVVNFLAAPQNSSGNSTCLTVTIQNGLIHCSGFDPDALEGLTYGFRDAGDEFGGEADYVIEGRMEFATFLRTGNLYAAPTVGSEMGFTWLPVDPDGEDAYGGQLQCVAWAGGNMSEFANWVFVDTPAGPSPGTAVEEDSWARIKMTIVQ